MISKLLNVTSSSNLWRELLIVISRSIQGSIMMIVILRIDVLVIVCVN